MPGHIVLCYTTPYHISSKTQPQNEAHLTTPRLKANAVRTRHDMPRHATGRYTIHIIATQDVLSMQTYNYMLLDAMRCNTMLCHARLYYAVAYYPPP